MGFQPSTEVKSFWGEDTSEIFEYLGYWVSDVQGAGSPQCGNPGRCSEKCESENKKFPDRK